MPFADGPRGGIMVTGAGGFFAAAVRHPSRSHPSAAEEVVLVTVENEHEDGSYRSGR